MAKPDPRRLDPARYPFHSSVTTRFTDLDPNGHVNNLAICEAVEDARVRMWDALDDSDGEQRIIVSMTVEYLGEADHSGPIEVHSGVLSIGRTSFVSEHYAMQAGRPVAYQTAVLVHRVGGEVVLTPHWRALLETALVRPVED